MTTEAQAAPLSERTAWSRNLQTPLREFVRTETGGAAVLLAAAIAALVWVNVDASSYDSVWRTTLSIEVGGTGVSLGLREWVNSGLMTFFFFVVGLEARRSIRRLLTYFRASAGAPPRGQSLFTAEKSGRGFDVK